MKILFGTAQDLVSKNVFAKEDIFMPKLPIITKKEIVERGKTEKKLPVINLDKGIPQNIYSTEATAYDIPFEAVPSNIINRPLFGDTVILDIRKRLRAAEKLKYCDIKTLDAICEVSKFTDIQSIYLRNLQPSVFDFLINDVDKLKKDFVYNCRSIPIEKIIEEIKTDIKNTIRAINVPMDIEDRLEIFSFYLSGLMKGYMTVFENMKIELEFPLIDNIMNIYRGYQKQYISASDAWKYIEDIYSNK